MNWKLIAFACAMSATVALAADEIAEKLSLADVQVTRGEGLYRCQVHRGGGRDTRPDNSLETFLIWSLGFDNFATDDRLVLFELLPELRKPALSPES